MNDEPNPQRNWTLIVLSVLWLLTLGMVLEFRSRTLLGINAILAIIVLGYAIYLTVVGVRHPFSREVTRSGNLGCEGRKRKAYS